MKTRGKALIAVAALSALAVGSVGAQVTGRWFDADEALPTHTLKAALVARRPYRRRSTASGPCAWSSRPRTCRCTSPTACTG
jgi:hypothetical protein